MLYFYRKAYSRYQLIFKANDIFWANTNHSTTEATHFVLLIINIDMLNDPDDS